MVTKDCEDSLRELIDYLEDILKPTFLRPIPIITDDDKKEIIVKVADAISKCSTEGGAPRGSSTY